MLPINPHQHLPTKPHWREPQQIDVPKKNLFWLTASGSLTKRLMALGQFAVQPQQEVVKKATQTEYALLDINVATDALIREVILTLDDIPVVVARTVVPISSLQGENSHLGQMANRSLGGELFQPPAAIRKQLWLTQLDANNPLGTLWGRQNLYIKRAAPLLVAEYFTHEFWLQFAP